MKNHSFFSVRGFLLGALTLLSPTMGKAQSNPAGGRLYPTLGNPTSAIATPDGKYVFVSVTNVGASNFTGSDAAAGARKDVVSGIQVFAVQHGELTAMTFVKTAAGGVNGLVLLRKARTLAVGMGDLGVAFLDVESLVQGDAAPVCVGQGEAAGTFDLVATPDGKYVFAANEYGVIDQQRGNVGIIETHIDAQGSVHHPTLLGHLAAGDVVPSLMISPDGSRLYVASELLPAKANPDIAGSGNPALTRHDCVQKKGSPARSNGYISVVDVRRAVAKPSTDAIVSRIASGCSPVRLEVDTETPTLYVTARGDNAVLAFDTQKLEAAPESAFLRLIPTGGQAPVGLRLFQHGRKLAVANSNRFADDAGTLAILDLKDSAAHPSLRAAGVFPRNLSLSPQGDTLYLTNYTSRSLQVISLQEAQ